MPLLIILGIFLPRLVSVYLYFFTGWFMGVFETQMWPILGFIFMPYTMLWYSAVVNWYGGEWDLWQIVVLGVAIISDLSSNKGGFTS
ncbi:MAG: hypothetical protein WD605_01905 [Candidatus Paceibacterota bacterium]